MNEDEGQEGEIRGMATESLGEQDTPDNYHKDSAAGAHPERPRLRPWRSEKYDTPKEWEEFKNIRRYHSRAFYKWCCWLPGQNGENWPANKDYLPGRIIYATEPDHDPTFDEFEWLPDFVGSNDVVWIPLYQGSLKDPTPQHWPQQPLQDYGKFIALMEEIAPRVKGILFGNNGCELLYRPSVAIQEQKEDIPEGHIEINVPLGIHYMCEFVAQTAPLVLRAGGRPFYGTMDWAIIMDCYTNVMRGHLRRIVNACNGVHVCFCASSLFAEAVWDRTNKLLSDKSEILMMYEKNDSAMPKLQIYLQGGEFWGDIGGWEGLQAGNNFLLQQHGFKELIL